MPAEFLEAKPRDFNPTAVSGLTNEARDGVNAVLKAVSTWRNEIAATNEKNGKRVMEQMAAAASALGWPEQVVDTARTQLQSVAEMQIKTMDQLMDACQIAEPDDRLAIGNVVQAKIFARFRNR